MPFFDEDNKVVYFANKGESAVPFFQYSTSGNYLDYLHVYKGKDPQKGFSFMPKRIVDFMKCEVARAVRLTAKYVEYVSFKVPRKSGTFQADLYPPCKAPKAAFTFDEWQTGKNMDAERMELKPESSNVQEATMARKQTLMSKLKGGPASDQPSSSIPAASGNDSEL